jgi:hypothetical protein
VVDNAGAYRERVLRSAVPWEAVDGENQSGKGLRVMTGKTAPMVMLFIGMVFSFAAQIECL